jgi:isoamylase
MILAGDELGRSQRGNNNAYCQDNEVSWIDWDRITDEGKSLTDFTRKLTMLRHALPKLRRNRFLTAEFNEEIGVKDVTWLKASGEEFTDEDWKDKNMRFIGMLMDGRAQVSGIKRPASDVTLLWVQSAHHEAVQLTLPRFADGDRWLCLIDTNDPDRADTSFLETGDKYNVAGRSLLLFAALTPGDPGRAIRRIAFELSRTSHVPAQ